MSASGVLSRRAAAGVMDGALDFCPSRYNSAGLTGKSVASGGATGRASIKSEAVTAAGGHRELCVGKL